MFRLNTAVSSVVREKSCLEKKKQTNMKCMFFYPRRQVLSDWPLVDSGFVCPSGTATTQWKVVPRLKFPWQLNAQPYSWQKDEGGWRGRRGWEWVWGAKRRKAQEVGRVKDMTNTECFKSTICVPVYYFYMLDVILTPDYQWQVEWVSNWPTVQPDSLKSPVGNQVRNM